MTTKQTLAVWTAVADRVPLTHVAAVAREYAPVEQQAGLSDTTVYRLLRSGVLPQDQRFRRRLLKYVPRALFALAAQHDMVGAVALALGSRR